MIEYIYKKYFFKFDLNLIYDIENIFLSLNLFFKNIDFIFLLSYNI